MILREETLSNNSYSSNSNSSRTVKEGLKHFKDKDISLIDFKKILNMYMFVILV